MKRKKQRHKKPRPEVSPVTMLSDELDAVRRDLRRTIRAYAARLELDLAESIVAVTRYKGTEDLPRERLHDIRDLTIMMRKRKLKPKRAGAKMCASSIRSFAICTQSPDPTTIRVIPNETEFSRGNSATLLVLISVGWCRSRTPPRSVQI